MGSPSGTAGAANASTAYLRDFFEFKRIGCNMKSWFILFIAGVLECGWAVGLKYTDAFTRFWPSLWTVVALAGSMMLLAVAVRELPIGTAYPIWVGIGAIGAAVYGMVVLGEAASALRILFLLLLIIAIAGLKATSPADVHGGAETSQGPSTDLHGRAR